MRRPAGTPAGGCSYARGVDTVRIRRLLGIVLVVATVLPVGRSAGAQTQAELEARAAELAAEINVLAVDAETAGAALDALVAERDRQQQRLDDARAAVAGAQREITAAREREDAANAKIDELTGQLRELAVAAYLRPPSTDIGALLADDDVRAGAKRRVFASVGASTTDDVVNRLRGERQRAERARTDAERAEAEAKRLEAAEAAQFTTVQAASDAQQRLADDIAANLERKLAEANSVGEQLAAREQELARAARRAGGGVSRPGWTRNGPITVVTVYGIEVNTEIAGQVRAMVDAAAADGIELYGEGYRDIQTQIDLRRAHCGSSDWAIWDMPSMDCSPPVARPGFSMHEQGLAIDFFSGGDLVRSRSNPIFRWLAANAASFGFYNLPIEPWHWSTTGG